MWRWRAAWLAAALIAGTQVIAAQDTIDHFAAHQLSSTAAPTHTTAPAALDLVREPHWSALDVAMTIAAVGVIIAFFLMRWHRLDQAPARRAAIPSSASLILMLAMYVLGVLGGAAAQFICGIGTPGGDSPAPLGVDDIAKITLGGYVSQSIALAVYFHLQRTRKSDGMLDGRMNQTTAALLGVAALTLVWPVVNAVANLAAWILGQPVDAIAHDTLRQLVAGPFDGWHILLCILVVFVAPLMEEVMYRGLLQTALIRLFRSSGRSRGRWPAIILTSVTFAAMHIRAVPPHGLPALFAFSVALGWAYEKTGRLIACVTMHVLFNAANLGLALLLSHQT